MDMMYIDIIVTVDVEMHFFLSNKKPQIIFVNVEATESIPISNCAFVSEIPK